MRDTDLVRAEAELIRFLRKEWAEARRLGYPPMSAFAKDIARGTLAPTPPDDDPWHELLGRFYQSLEAHEKRAISERFMSLGTARKRAENVGLSVWALNSLIRRIVRRCADYLVRYA